MTNFNVESQQAAAPTVFYVSTGAPQPQSSAINVIGGAAGSIDETPTISVGREPIIMTCPHCRCRNKTRTTLRATAKTHLACCLLSWTLCFCRLPYRMTSCLNTDHFCPTCDAFLGTYVA